MLLDSPDKPSADLEISITVLFLLTAAATLIASQFSLLWVIGFGLTPIPIFLLAVKHGFRLSLASWALSEIIFLILGGWKLALVIGGIFIFLGLVFSIPSLLQIKAGFRISIAAILISTFLLVGFSTVYAKDGNHILTSERKMLTASIAKQKRAILLAGAKPAAAKQFVKQARELISLLPFLVIALVLVFSIWSAFAYQLCLEYLSTRAKFDFKKLPKFTEWVVPWPFSYGFIAGLAGVLFYNQFTEWARFIHGLGLDLLIVFGLLYTIQGVSIVGYYLKNRKLSKPTVVLLAIAAFLIQFIFQVLTWIGLFDTWFDFRRLDSKREKPKK